MRHHGGQRHENVNLRPGKHLSLHKWWRNIKKCENRVEGPDSRVVSALGTGRCAQENQIGCEPNDTHWPSLLSICCPNLIQVEYSWVIWEQSQSKFRIYEQKLYQQTPQKLKKKRHYLQYYMYLSTFCHNGRTLPNHSPATRCLGTLVANCLREQKSAGAFSLDEIHLA